MIDDNDLQKIAAIVATKEDFEELKNEISRLRMTIRLIEQSLKSNKT